MCVARVTSRLSPDLVATRAQLVLERLVVAREHLVRLVRLVQVALHLSLLRVDASSLLLGFIQLSLECLHAVVDLVHLKVKVTHTMHASYVS